MTVAAALRLARLLWLNNDLDSEPLYRALEILEAKMHIHVHTICTVTYAYSSYVHMHIRIYVHMHICTRHAGFHQSREPSATRASQTNLSQNRQHAQPKCKGWFCLCVSVFLCQLIEAFLQVCCKPLALYHGQALFVDSDIHPIQLLVILTRLAHRVVFRHVRKLVFRPIQQSCEEALQSQHPS